MATLNWTAVCVINQFHVFFIKRRKELGIVNKKKMSVLQIAIYLNYLIRILINKWRNYGESLMFDGTLKIEGLIKYYV